MTNNFYEKLRDINHFKLHSELIPYVGPHYNEFRILLVGESHYVGDCYKNQEHFFDKWYSEKTESFNWKKFDDTEWFNTRGVIESFLSGKSYKAYSMFRNPSTVIADTIEMKCNINIKPVNAFVNCAFMNFFQRPEIQSGKSIKDLKVDRDRAKDIFEEVISIIEPKIVVFLSKKSYKVYSSYTSTLNRNSSVHWVAHPTSPHWYKENGKIKFMMLISGFFDGENQFDIKNGILDLVKANNHLIEQVFNYIQNELIKTGLFEIRISELKDTDSIIHQKTCFGIFKSKSHCFALKFSISDNANILFGLCNWDEQNNHIDSFNVHGRSLVHKKLTPENTTKRKKYEWCWYDTFATLPKGLTLNECQKIDYSNKKVIEETMKIQLEKLNETIDLIKLYVSYKLD